MKQTSVVNKKISEYRQNFYKVYHSTLAPLLQRYEQKRKCSLTNLLIWLSTVITVGFISAYEVFFHVTATDGVKIFNSILLVVLVILLILLPIYFNDKFIKELKAECMPSILKIFGEISWYNGINLVEDKDMENSDLFSYYNRRSTDDSFLGNYSGVDFKISETHMEHESGSGKNRRVITIFKGVVAQFKLDRHIKNKTIIATRGDMNIKRGGPILSILSIFAYLVISLIQSMPNGISWNFIIGFSIFFTVLTIIILLLINAFKNKKEALNEIKLEDPEFSKKYKAYSSDQVEGRYLITPAFMERFKNIQTSFGTSKVKCSFFDDNLMFAISTGKNLFEIGNLFYKLDNPKQMETFFNEITSVFLLVDYFKLNENIGL